MHRAVEEHTSCTERGSMGPRGLCPASEDEIDGMQVGCACGEHERIAYSLALWELLTHHSGKMLRRYDAQGHQYPDDNILLFFTREVIVCCCRVPNHRCRNFCLTAMVKQLKTVMLSKQSTQSSIAREASTTMLSKQAQEVSR